MFIKKQNCSLISSMIIFSLLIITLVPALLAQNSNRSEEYYHEANNPTINELDDLELAHSDADITNYQLHKEYIYSPCYDTISEEIHQSLYESLRQDQPRQEERSMGYGGEEIQETDYSNLPEYLPEDQHQPVEPVHVKPDPEDMPEAEYDSPEHQRLMALNQENDPNIYTSIEPLEFTVRPKWTLEELENKIKWLERLIENPDLLGTEDYPLRDSLIAVPCNIGLYHEPLEKIPFDKEHEKQIGKCKTGITLDKVIQVYRKQLKQMIKEGYDNTTDFVSDNYDEMLYWRPLRLPERTVARMQPDAQEKYRWMNSLTEPPEEYLENFSQLRSSPRERPSEASSWSYWYEYWDGYSNSDWNYYYNWNAYYVYGGSGTYTPTSGDLVVISDDYGYYRECQVYNANTARVYQVLVYDYDYLRIRSSRTLYIGNSGDSNWEYAMYCESGSRIYCGDSGNGYINMDNYTSSTSCNAPTSTCQIGYCFTVDGYFYMYSGNCYLDDDLIVHGYVYHYNGNIYTGYSSRSTDGALYISGSSTARYYHYDGYLYVERNFYTSGGYGSYGTGNVQYYGYTNSDVYVGYDGSSTCNNSRIYVFDSYSYFYYLRIYGTSNSYLYCSGGGKLDVNSHFYIRSGVTFHSNGYTMYVGDDFYDYGTFDHDNNTVYLDTANDGYIYGDPTFYYLRLTKSASGDYMRIASNVTTYYLYLDEGRVRHDYSSSYTMTIHYYVYCYAGAEYYQTTGTTNIINYDFNNRGGELDMRGGTMNINRHLYNNNGYSSNVMNISGGTINAGYIPNYEGVMNHSGGTITSDNYYRENDSGGGNYYGSGSALLRMDGTGGTKYIRLMRSGTYFNDLTINGSGYYIETGSTQNLDVNRHFTINSGDSFDSNGYAMYVGGNWLNNGTFTHDNNYVYLDGSLNSTLGGSSSSYFYYLRPNKSSRTTTITMTNNINAYRVEPWRGTFNMNGYRLHCSTYFLANYDNNDTYDVIVNVGSGRINAPNGFQIRRGARVNMNSSSGVIDCGYFIVYNGTNDGVFDMDAGTMYCSSYLYVYSGAYFYGDGGKVRMDGSSTTYIRNYNTTNSYFYDLEIYKTGSSYIYLNTGDIKVNHELLVPLSAGVGGIMPSTYSIWVP